MERRKNGIRRRKSWQKTSKEKVDKKCQKKSWQKKVRRKGRQNKTKGKWN